MLTLVPFEGEEIATKDVWEADRTASGSEEDARVPWGPHCEERHDPLAKSDDQDDEPQDFLLT